MVNNIKENSINTIAIQSDAINILKNNKIDKIGKLEKLTKPELKKMGLNNSEINKIDIELQLLGLSLKGTK